MNNKRIILFSISKSFLFNFNKILMKYLIPPTRAFFYYGLFYLQVLVRAVILVLLNLLPADEEIRADVVTVEKKAIEDLHRPGRVLVGVKLHESASLVADASERIVRKSSRGNRSLLWKTIPLSGNDAKSVAHIFPVNIARNVADEELILLHGLDIKIFISIAGKDKEATALLVSADVTADFFIRVVARALLLHRLRNRKILGVLCGLDERSDLVIALFKSLFRLDFLDLAPDFATSLRSCNSLSESRKILGRIEHGFRLLFTLLLIHHIGP